MIDIVPQLKGNSSKFCKACGGTGRDEAKTKKAGCYDGSYVRCWECNGNGLDPAEFFSWGDHNAK